MTSLGGNSITHSQVLKVIVSEGGHGLKLKSTWKESWAIMQDMVKSNMLEKTDSSYSINQLLITFLPEFFYFNKNDYIRYIKVNYGKF